jgi:CIC family chloride channel protein
VVDKRVVAMSGLAILLGLASGVIARTLTALIAVITNAAFFGRWSIVSVGPAANRLGWLVVLFSRPVDAWGVR